MARLTRFATEFPLATGLLRSEGFVLKGRRFARPRRNPAFEAFDVVEVAWSNIVMGYRFHIGVSVPLIEQALGSPDSDPYDIRSTLLGVHDLGGQRWPQIEPAEMWISGTVTRGEEDDRKAVRELRRLALTWFEPLQLTELARSVAVWEPYALLLLHLLGEDDEVASRLAGLDRDAVAGREFSEWSADQAGEARRALAYLSAECNDE